MRRKCVCVCVCECVNAVSVSQQDICVIKYVLNQGIDFKLRVCVLMASVQCACVSPNTIS